MAKYGSGSGLTVALTWNLFARTVETHKNLGYPMVLSLFEPSTSRIQVLRVEC